MSIAWFGGVERGPSDRCPRSKERRMAQLHHTSRLHRTEEALTVLFCLVDDAYRILNPRGERYASLKRRLRKLRRFLEPLRRAVVGELVGEPETLIVDSTLLSVLHPRQVKQST